jgi:hypothetical protein
MTPLEGLVHLARSQDMEHRSDQEVVTRSLLVPSMPRLVESLGVLRRECDSWIRSESNRQGTRPSGHESSRLSDYPIGFCSVIRDFVHEGMLGLPEVQHLLRSGVVLKKVFVILKGLYFQNAIQMGNLYIDVANDTVDPSKPWLEWMHVREVPYTNIGDLPTLISVAERYHQCRAYPNLFFPLLAPVVPLLAIRANGRLELLHFQDGGFLKDLPEGLHNLRSWLSGAAQKMDALPAEYVSALQSAFGSNDFSSFPFEYRHCSPDEVAAQADSYASAFADPSGHETILAVLKLVPQSLRRFSSLNLGMRD